jgi:hypothetical protein
MRRSRARRRLVSASLVLLVVSAGSAAILSGEGSDEQRTRPRMPPASPRTRARPRQPSPVRSSLPRTPAAPPGPTAARARARKFLTGYLALLHGRGSIQALRLIAARELLRDLRRNGSRVTPAQQQTGSRILHVNAEPRSAASVRVVATVKPRAGPSYPLQLYLERRGARWVVTRIGDA